jgi:hypothetical protein
MKRGEKHLQKGTTKRENPKERLTSMVVHTKKRRTASL